MNPDAPAGASPPQPAETTTPAQAGAPTHQPAGTTTPTLAARQAALVAALVAGAPTPPGFAPEPLAAARAALLRKRAGEVARHWPLLAAGLGRRWPEVFRRWADGRPTAGSLRDGWDLARELRDARELPPLGAEELAAREAGHRYDGRRAPRPRRLPARGCAGGAVAVQFAGRVRLLRPARRWPADTGGSGAEATFLVRGALELIRDRHRVDGPVARRWAGRPKQPGRPSR